MVTGGRKLGPWLAQADGGPEGQAGGGWLELALRKACVDSVQSEHQGGAPTQVGLAQTS